jgi:hypothetical protein
MASLLPIVGGDVRELSLFPPVVLENLDDVRAPAAAAAAAGGGVLQPAAAAAADAPTAPPARVVAKIRICAACKRQGHQRNSKKCPMHAANVDHVFDDVQ